MSSPVSIVCACTRPNRNRKPICGLRVMILWCDLRHFSGSMTTLYNISWPSKRKRLSCAKKPNTLDLEKWDTQNMAMEIFEIVLLTSDAICVFNKRMADLDAPIGGSEIGIFQRLHKPLKTCEFTGWMGHVDLDSDFLVYICETRMTIRMSHSISWPSNCG